MRESSGVPEFDEDVFLKKSNKWNRVLKISNTILSVLYGLSWWIFSYLGLFLFELAFLSENPFQAIFPFIAALLFLLIPVFCGFAIFLSVSYRRKNDFIASFWVQFFPFGILGVGVIMLFISII